MSAKVEPDQRDDERVAKLNDCKIWIKVKNNQLHLVTERDVEEVFDILDEQERGSIDPDDMKVLSKVHDLAITENDIMAIAKDCDRDGSGSITPAELFRALTEESFAKKKVIDGLDPESTVTLKSTECHRDQLKEFLHKEYDTNEALWSLPTTMTTFLLFFSFQFYHMTTSVSFEVQDAIFQEVIGEGRPYLMEYVHDIPTFWDWMEQSMAPAHFRQDLDIFPYPGRVASYNQIVGGIQLAKTTTNPQECAQADVLRTVYDSFSGVSSDGVARSGGMCHKGGDSSVTSEYFISHQKVDDVVARFMALRSEGWVDQDVQQVEIIILFYNGHYNTFTKHHLTITFFANGKVLPIFNQETFQSDPYFNKGVLVIDVLFILLLLKTVWGELKEMVPAAMNGLDGLADYLEFWNVVDWLNILFGVVMMVMWAMITIAVSSDLQSIIAELPNPLLDTAVLTRGSYLNQTEMDEITPSAVLNSKIEELHHCMDDIGYLHGNLRQILFFYSFTLMLKYFKAFRANPRLDVVIRTMKAATNDIVHFLIVFGIIFMVFALMAMIMFGRNIKGFSGPVRAIMECWSVLNGNFDIAEMELVNPAFAYVWMVGFQFMVGWILLNMLLAIIMDTYTEVKGGMSNAQEIWVQWKEAVETVRKTRGFIELWTLICELEDDDFPAHPRPKVTVKSLRAAFKDLNMKSKNAEWLIQKTVDHEQEKRSEKAGPGLVGALSIIAQLKTVVWRINSTVNKTLELQNEEKKKPQKERFEAIFDGRDAETLEKKAKMGINNPIATHQPGANNPAYGSSYEQGSPGTAQGVVHGVPVEPMLGLPSSVENHSEGGHHSFGGPDTGDIVRKLDRVLAGQAKTEAAIGDQGKWLESRITALERRFERIDNVGEKLRRLLDTIDFASLGDVPKSVSQVLRAVDVQGTAMQKLSTGAAEEASAMLANSPTNMGASATRKRLFGNQNSDGTAGLDVDEKLSKQIEGLRDQVEQMTVQSSEITEIKRMIFGMEVMMRTLRAGNDHSASNAPGAPLVFSRSTTNAASPAPRAVSTVSRGLAHAGAVVIHGDPSGSENGDARSSHGSNGSQGGFGGRSPEGLRDAGRGGGQRGGDSMV